MGGENLGENCCFTKLRDVAPMYMGQLNLNSRQKCWLISEDKILQQHGHEGKQFIYRAIIND